MQLMQLRVLHIFLLSDERASPVNYLLDCITSGLIYFKKQIAGPINIYLCLSNSRSANMYDILWWQPCSNSIISPIRFSAFVNTQKAFLLDIRLCCVHSLQLVQSAFNGSLAVYDSLSNAHRTRIAIIPLELFVILRLCHAPAEQGQTNGDHAVHVRILYSRSVYLKPRAYHWKCSLTSACES